LIVHVHFDAKYKVEGLEYLTSNDEVLSDRYTQKAALNSEKTAQKKGGYKRAFFVKNARL